MSDDDRRRPSCSRCSPPSAMRRGLTRACAMRGAQMASTLGVTLASAGASGAATSGAHAALPKALLGKSIGQAARRGRLSVAPPSAAW